MNKVVHAALFAPLFRRLCEAFLCGAAWKAFAMHWGRNSFGVIGSSNAVGAAAVAPPTGVAAASGCTAPATFTAPVFSEVTPEYDGGGLPGIAASEEAISGCAIGRVGMASCVGVAYVAYVNARTCTRMSYIGWPTSSVAVCAGKHPMHGSGKALANERLVRRPTLLQQEQHCALHANLQDAACSDIPFP